MKKVFIKPTIEITDFVSDDVITKLSWWNESYIEESSSGDSSVDYGDPEEPDF